MVIRPGEIARMIFSLLPSGGEAEQMAKQYLPGLLGGSLDKRDESTFDTLHTLLLQMKNGPMLHKKIQELMTDVLKRHQANQFRISIISLPLPVVKKGVWGGKKGDKFASHEVREELNPNDPRLHNLAQWARMIYQEGEQKTVQALIAKNMISESSLPEQVNWAIAKAKELGYPILDSINNPKWTTQANQKLGKFRKWGLLPLGIFVFLLLIILLVKFS
ncbi:MAG: hypothetical protein IPL87_00940 [Candidatus Moraniibacteriota bacterium]|nr:MAG: hypothetical protein IPL87_00940 [Candidatus Moranbacteria bacterium]